MGKYQAFDPESKVLGALVQAFINSVQYEKIKPHLEHHGFDDVDPTEWYRLQGWLDVLSDLEGDQTGSAMLDFVSIGIKINESAVYPPEMQGMTFKQILGMFNDAHYMNHQGDVGRFDVEFPEETHAVITYRLPYPDDFIYGGFFGEARRWLPDDTDFTIEYDPDITRHDHGGEATVVHIRWE
ncbi:MAG: hypothetical protein GYB65_19540 [Chloroflexi bacterium]|nr:hypothetical protein [Chloroflexota bacterium]